ncbi:sensor histidine kinase, partial [Sphaerotilus sp.]|uniref:sensor histidine kinase n=1 Tax=Sphaerotilus sp. TaxID=2093942 RepID=UPI0034E29F00
LFGLAARLREADIAVTVAVEPPDLRAMADAMRLEQVLVNLLTNAIDALAGTAAPRITVHAHRTGEQIQLVIGNNGPAITPDVLRRLFEPFVTTKPAGKGLGLGLVLSARLVQGFGGRLQGGNLDASGVAFTIELPAAPEPSDPA